jgi:hypothetical protein
MIALNCLDRFSRKHSTGAEYNEFLHSGEKVESNNVTFLSREQISTASRLCYW